MLDRVLQYYLLPCLLLHRHARLQHSEYERAHRYSSADREHARLSGLGVGIAEILRMTLICCDFVRIPS